MAVSRYVALLRGINVGGRNKVLMADLRAAMAPRFGAVETYIQSGNLLFESGEAAGSLEVAVETILADAFGFDIPVVVRSHRQLRSVVDEAPPGFGTAPDTYHSDVLFLKAPLTAAELLGAVELRDGVDQAWPGDGVAYFARLSARRTQSRMSKIAGTSAYRLLTIRNWATTTRLLELMDGG